MTQGFGTASVAVATTPTVVSTFFTHIFAKRKRKSAAKKSLKNGGPGGGPEAQLSYEEGLKVVRRFLDFASQRGVEEVQAFTAMAVPTPTWVHRQTVTVPTSTIQQAEEILSEHLSSYGSSDAEGAGGGLKLVGGDKWWRVRGRELEGEWIEMQKDYLRRTGKTHSRGSRKSTKETHVSGSSSVRNSEDVNGRHSEGSSNGFGFGSESEVKSPTTYTSSFNHHFRKKILRNGTMDSAKVDDAVTERVILYIHGGAFFFSSLDTHRYQVQRHARKAGARAFTPAYRLAPQYPFPCGILDALSSYLYLLDPPPGAHDPILPSSIIFMGDSAGAGMVISLLVVIREMGLPMPAGASLISPWVDLTHSMPSIGGWDGGDYIPSSGFHYKPSVAWPPLPGSGITVTMPEGGERQFDEQIQMYCPNNLLTHPLVSPVNLGSLGGLCPLLIIGGGGELLRDEITYIAHKAANPTMYPPSSRTLAQYPDQVAAINKYKPTKVHLQIYEGCCHVGTTLSWTRSAKYMYRACANFNIWAYTAAGKAVERHLNHKTSKSKLAAASRQSTIDESSVAPSPSTTVASSRVPSVLDLTQPIITNGVAKKANAEDIDMQDLESEASSSTDESNSVIGDPDSSRPIVGVVTVKGTEPLFGHDHIVAQRVSTHGNIRPFEAIEAVPALDPKLRESIGQIRGDGAIQKWLHKRAEWDKKYGSQLEKWRKIRMEDRRKAEEGGFLTGDLHGENPPLCSLVGWHDRGLARLAGEAVDEIGTRTNKGILLWTKMSSKADEEHAGGDNMKEIKENVKQELQQEAASGAPHEPLGKPVS